MPNGHHKMFEFICIYCPLDTMPSINKVLLIYLYFTQCLTQTMLVCLFCKHISQPQRLFLSHLPFDGDKCKSMFQLSLQLPSIQSTRTMLSLTQILSINMISVLPCTSISQVFKNDAFQTHCCSAQWLANTIFSSSVTLGKNS